ncbi:hypothetical protein [Propionibacterium acidifaciens]|uniref:hypothetical protein n=1 Tax=Propionibacterium acidifaciens TaxID=556499 RepID=UPI0012DCBA4E|nr:hypothetical protein [Propionibacterium acidifaciens]
MDRMYAGTEIHNAVQDKIKKLFPGVEYNSNNGPDFRIPKELSGADADEFVELTTPGQVPAHQRKTAKDPRYGDAQYATYEIP